MQNSHRAAGAASPKKIRKQSSPVAVINAEMARRHFAGEDPVGKRLSLQVSLGEGEPAWREIVGVVGDVKHIRARRRSEARNLRALCSAAHKRP